MSGMHDAGGTAVSVYLLRHAQTDWNRERRLQGHTDRPLTDAALHTLRTCRIPARLEGLAVFVSPLLRARQTAAALGLADNLAVPELLEMDWGAWEGRTLADLRAELGDHLIENESAGLDFRPEGGESPREVGLRLRPWLRSIAVAGKPVIAVTHKGVIRAVMAAAWRWNMLGRPPHKLDWQCLHELRVTPEGELSVGEMNITLDRR